MSMTPQIGASVNQVPSIAPAMMNRSEAINQIDTFKNEGEYPLEIPAEKMSEFSRVYQQAKECFKNFATDLQKINQMLKQEIDEKNSQIVELIPKVENGQEVVDGNAVENDDALFSAIRNNGWGATLLKRNPNIADEHKLNYISRMKAEKVYLQTKTQVVEQFLMSQDAFSKDQNQNFLVFSFSKAMDFLQLADYLDDNFEFVVEVPDNFEPTANEGKRKINLEMLEKFLNKDSNNLTDEAMAERCKEAKALLIHMGDRKNFETYLSRKASALMGGSCAPGFRQMAFEFNVPDEMKQALAANSLFKDFIESTEAIPKSPKGDILLPMLIKCFSFVNTNQYIKGFVEGSY